MAKRPSQQIAELFEIGGMCPSIDFWCYKQAERIMWLPQNQRRNALNQLPSAYHEKIYTYCKKLLH